MPTGSEPVPPSSPPAGSSAPGTPRSGLGVPAAPVWAMPDSSHHMYDLWERVQRALRALPFYFRSETMVEGIDARDLFTLNSALGATIEKQVVDTLNAMRAEWDPDDKYRLYGFVRQPQTFPDVRLQRVTDTGSAEVLFGVELKGWWLLSGEGEPSFRYSVTPLAASAWDLLVVVPWYLDRVISGTPRALPPFITGAMFAAEMRNHYWQHMRGSGNPVITPPAVITPPPYPSKADKISDKPTSDSGGNFGRLARSRIMDAFVAETLDLQLAGIEARLWVTFFKTYAETATPPEVIARLERARRELARHGTSPEERSELDEAFVAIIERLQHRR